MPKPIQTLRPHSVHWMEIKHPNWPIFSPKYLLYLLFHTNRAGYIQVLHFQSLLVTFLFLPQCQVLKSTENYPQTLSFVPIRHHWNRKAMATDWQDVSCWKIGILSFQSSSRPGQLISLYTVHVSCQASAVCLARTDLKGRQALIFASRFWTLATQRFYLKCNIEPLTILILSSDISYTLWIFSHWMHNGFLLFLTFLIVSFSLLFLRMVELQRPNCYTQGCEFILLNYSLVYLVSLFYIRHSFKWFSLYWHFIMPS